MEMMNCLIFNGYDLRDYGMYVSGNKTFDSPKKEYTKISIPGRSGDLVSFNGRYSNVTLSYDAILISDYERNAAAIRSILLSADGYCRLEDSYHKDEYRMAMFAGPLNFDSIFLEAGQTVLSFDCKPQRWLKSGEDRILIADNIQSSETVTFEEDGQQVTYYQDMFTINNPTLFPAKPLFQVKGYGKMRIYVGHEGDIYENGFYITANYTNDPMYQVHSIDCDSMTGKKSLTLTSGPAGTRRETDPIGFYDIADDLLDRFPTLNPGEAVVYVLRTQPTLSKVYLTPRWYIL